MVLPSFNALVTEEDRLAFHNILLWLLQNFAIWRGDLEKLFPWVRGPGRWRDFRRDYLDGALRHLKGDEYTAYYNSRAALCSKPKILGPDDWADEETVNEINRKSKEAREHLFKSVTPHHYFGRHANSPVLPTAIRLDCDADLPFAVNLALHLEGQMAQNNPSDPHLLLASQAALRVAFQALTSHPGLQIKNIRGCRGLPVSGKQNWQLHIESEGEPENEKTIIVAVVNLVDASPCSFLPRKPRTKEKTEDEGAGSRHAELWHFLYHTKDHAQKEA